IAVGPGLAVHHQLPAVAKCSSRLTLPIVPRIRLHKVAVGSGLHRPRAKTERLDHVPVLRRGLVVGLIADHRLELHKGPQSLDIIYMNTSRAVQVDLPPLADYNPNWQHLCQRRGEGLGGGRLQWRDRVGAPAGASLIRPAVGDQLTARILALARDRAQLERATGHREVAILLPLYLPHRVPEVVDCVAHDSQLGTRDTHLQLQVSAGRCGVPKVGDGHARILTKTRYNTCRVPTGCHRLAIVPVFNRKKPGNYTAWRNRTWVCSRVEQRPDSRRQWPSCRNRSSMGTSSPSRVPHGTTTTSARSFRVVAKPRCTSVRRSPTNVGPASLSGGSVRRSSAGSTVSMTGGPRPSG